MYFRIAGPLRGAEAPNANLRTKAEGLGCVEDGPKDRIKVAHLKSFAVFPAPLDPSIRILRPGLKRCETSGIQNVQGGDGAWGKLSTTDVIATCDHEKGFTSCTTHQDKSTNSKNQPASQSHNRQRVYYFFSFGHRPLDVSKKAPCHRIY
jgi:hypothetical protein